MALLVLLLLLGVLSLARRGLRGPGRDGVDGSVAAPGPLRGRRAGREARGPRLGRHRPRRRAALGLRPHRARLRRVRAEAEGLLPRLRHHAARLRRVEHARTTGYDEPSLSNDVWTVIETLGLKAPVLIGHSMAGAELTGVGMLHSDRLGGLVYLDAIGDSTDDPPDDPTWKALQAKLPPSGPPRDCTERSVVVRRVSGVPPVPPRHRHPGRRAARRASRRPRTAASEPRARRAGCRAPSARAGRRATTRRSRCRCSPSPMPSTSISRT